MNTLIVPLVGLAVVFVGLVVLIAIVKLMGVICGFVTGRRAETSGSVSSSDIEAEKVAADGNALPRGFFVYAVFHIPVAQIFIIAEPGPAVFVFE